MNGSYNGWSNWETWLVYSWLSNETEIYRCFSDLAEEAVDKEEPDLTETECLADDIDSWLQSEVEKLDLSNGMFCDLIRAGLHEVNCREISRAFMNTALQEYSLTIRSS
jgi:hypothetical protein